MSDNKIAETPALRDPRVVTDRDGKSRANWQDQARLALEARRQGAQLREGKLKSFRPVVGRI